MGTNICNCYHGDTRGAECGTAKSGGATSLTVVTLYNPMPPPPSPPEPPSPPPPPAARRVTTLFGSGVTGFSDNSSSYVKTAQYAWGIATSDGSTVPQGIYFTDAGAYVLAMSCSALAARILVHVVVAPALRVHLLHMRTQPTTAFVITTPTTTRCRRLSAAVQAHPIQKASEEQPCSAARRGA